MTDTKWRIIRLEAHTAFENMALDEACRESISSGKGSPTVRFYQWKPHAVSFGHYQNLEEVVDVKACQKHGIDVVRRKTGGGAVYHDEDEITYSVIAPESLFPQDLNASYREICSCLVNALTGLGLSARIEQNNDVAVNGKKVSGNSQARRSGVLLQHGTLLVRPRTAVMFQVLKRASTPEHQCYLPERVSPLSDFADLNSDKVYQSLLKAFAESRPHAFGSWTTLEQKRLQELSEKYASKEWVHETKWF